MRVNVFAQQGFYTEVHNALLDVVLPAVPPNAWKVLCVIVRQTKGWQRSFVGLNVHRIMALTGINSEHTVQKALAALRDFRQGERAAPLIVERQTGFWEPRVYGLNRKVQLDWFPVAESATEPVAESATEPVAESATEPVAESATLIRKEKSSEESNRSKQHAAAAAAGSRFDLTTIEAFIRETKTHAQNPPALARHIQRTGEEDAEIDAWLDAEQAETLAHLADLVADVERAHEAVARYESGAEISGEDMVSIYAVARRVDRANYTERELVLLHVAAELFADNAPVNQE